MGKKAKRKMPLAAAHLRHILCGARISLQRLESPRWPNGAPPLGSLSRCSAQTSLPLPLLSLFRRPLQSQMRTDGREEPARRVRLLRA